MAAILSPYSTVGFYKTPVTKCLLCSMFVSSCSLNVPHFAPLKKYFTCNVSDVLDRGDILQFLSCRSTFLDLKDLICSALLLYYFRVFERRYGAHKFASFLLATSAMSVLLEVFFLAVLNRFDANFFSGSFGYLSSGPFVLVFPLFVSYFFDIPRVAHSNIMGVPITGKTLTYLLGLQMVASSLSVAICSVCSIFAGLAYRYNVLNVQNWLRIPDFLAKLTAVSIGRLAASSPPQDGLIPMGATLEIQRTQQLEVLEQQMMFNRARDARAFGQLYDNVINHNNYQEQEEVAVVRRRNAASNYSDDSGKRFEQEDEEDETAAAAAASNDVAERGESSDGLNENQVQTLVEMGFDRHKVLAALRSSGNDIHMATSLLLRDS